MRLLFISGESEGGAPRSTIELGRQLVLRGHEVDVLVGDRSTVGSWYQRVVNLEVKLAAAEPLRRRVEAVLRHRGGRLTPVPDRSDGAPDRYIAPLPENAYRRLLDSSKPDVVIVNSLSRVAVRWIANDLSRRRLRWILYLREMHSLSHLAVTGVRPDAVVANSRELQREALDLGLPCDFIPSVVDLSASAATSTRETVLMVNPTADNRPERIIKMAELRPDIPFVLQESWTLDDQQIASLRALTAGLENVELRRRVSEPAAVYRDARVLIAPYPSGRPRVVLEAQANGIPVVALDQPALAEVVGPAGLLVPRNASDEEWISSIESLWDDEERYQELVRACRGWAAREDVKPSALAARFELLVESVIADEHV